MGNYLGTLEHCLFTLLCCFTMQHSHLIFVIPAFFLGRELAQAEYRYIEQYGGGKRANCPWWCGVTPSAWTVKGVLDWVLPLLVAVVWWMLV